MVDIWIDFDLETEARDVVFLFLERILGVSIPLRGLKIEDDLEICLFGEGDDFFVIGECMIRACPSGVLGVLEKTIKLSEHMSRLKEKKIVLIVYGIDVVIFAEEFAREYGVSIITPNRVLVEPKMLDLEEVKRNYERLLKRLGRLRKK